MNLRRPAGRPLVVGHRGAPVAAPENTLASLEAAVAAGADGVEFDVAPGLVLGHSLRELGDAPPALDDALGVLGGHPVLVHVDVKERGYEAEVLAAVRRHGLEERVLLSTAWAQTTRRLASLAPSLPRAIGYPRDRHAVSELPWPRPLERAGAVALRQLMPARLPLLLRWARADAVALHHTLCSPAAVATAHRLGAAVLAWTANDPAAVRRLAAAGVDAIVTDDPQMAVATLAAS